MRGPGDQPPLAEIAYPRDGGCQENLRFPVPGAAQAFTAQLMARAVRVAPRPHDLEGSGHWGWGGEMSTGAQRWIVRGGLCLATVAVYLQMADHAFIEYDDNVFITENPHLALGLSWEGVRWAFFEPYKEYWIPLTYLSWLAEYEVAGLDPRLHHLDSLWLHLGSTLLLFGFLTRTTGAVWCSGFVALVFAVHPLHVESVAWATERRDTLAVFFWMLAMWVYAGYATRAFSWLRFLGVALCVALSLLAKPLAVTLPFALLLLDLWPLGRLSSDSSRRLFEREHVRRAVLEKLALLPLVIFASVVAFLAQREAGAMSTIDTIPVSLRIGNAVYSYVVYLAKAFWPVNMGVFYPHPMESLSAFEVGGSAVLLSIFTVLALRVIRTRPWLTVGWFWFIGTMVPMIGIVQVGMQGMADRYTYLSLTGIGIIVAWGSVDLFGATKAGRAALAVAGACTGLALSVVSWVQVGYWRDTISLFTHTARVTEKNPVAHAVLGKTLLNAGRIDDAMPHLRAAVSYKPKWSTANWVLGNAYFTLGRHTEAIHSYRIALSLDKLEPGVHVDMAEVLESVGKGAEAVEHYKTALLLGAGRATASVHARLGLLYAELGEFEHARDQLEAALRADPEIKGIRKPLRSLPAKRKGGESAGGTTPHSAANRETR